MLTALWFGLFCADGWHTPSDDPKSCVNHHGLRLVFHDEPDYHVQTALTHGVDNYIYMERTPHEIHVSTEHVVCKIWSYDVAMALAIGFHSARTALTEHPNADFGTPLVNDLRWNLDMNNACDVQFSNRNGMVLATFIQSNHCKVQYDERGMRWTSCQYVFDTVTLDAWGASKTTLDFLKLIQ